MNSLSASRFARNLAQIPQVQMAGLAQQPSWVTVNPPGVFPQVHNAPVHIFVTPSLCGQVSLPGAHLPAISFARSAVWQGFAETDHGLRKPLQEPPFLSCVCFEDHRADKGLPPCGSRQRFLPSPAPQVSRRAVTRPMNRPSRAAQLALAPPSCWTATCLPARRSVQRATCFTVRTTRGAATKRTPQPHVALRRPVLLGRAALCVPRLRKGQPCSKRS